MPTTQPDVEIVGRDGLLAHFAGLVTALRAGASGSALALVGEPGIGKTRLLAAFADTARSAGVPVETVRDDGQLPWMVARAANGPPVVLVLDDLHRLPSRAAPGAAELLARSAGAPVLLAMAYRPRQLPPDLASVVARATAATMLEVHTVGPLGRAHARELLGDVRNADRIHGLAAGNPLYMRVLAGMPPEPAGALLAELAELTEAELRTAQVAAALGEEFTPDLLAAVAGEPAAAVLAALDGLVAKDLVRPARRPPLLAFRHPVLANVVYETANLSHRRAAHGRIEAELTRRGASVVERAAHVARAADPSSDRHFSTLLAAARQLLFADPATATQWLRTAQSLVPEADRRWVQAQVVLARAQLLAGRSGASRAALHQLRMREPAVSAVYAGVAERQLGRYDEAMAMLRVGLDGLSADGHPGGAAVTVHTELAGLAAQDSDYPGATGHAATAVAIARRHGDRIGEAAALGEAAVAHVYGGDVEAGRAATAAGAALIDAASDTDLISNLSSLYLVGKAEQVLEQLFDSERHLVRGVELARRTGQAHIMPSLLKSLGDVRLLFGRPDLALDALDEAYQLAERDRTADIFGLVAAMRAQSLVWLGEPGEAVELADRTLFSCRAQRWTWTVMSRCLFADALVQAGQPAKGGRLLLSAAGGPALPGLPAWRRVHWWEVLAQVGAATNDQERARHYADAAVRGVTEVPSTMRLGYARRAELRAYGPARAARATTEAVECFTAHGMRLDACVTLLAGVEAGLSGSAGIDVATLLDQADELAALCNSPALRDRAAAVRARLDGLDRPGPGRLTALTAREREIAVLAGEGLTSGEIAGRLRISVRTVDTHLGRVYHKLGVANRTALSGLLRES